MADGVEIKGEGTGGLTRKSAPVKQRQKDDNERVEAEQQAATDEMTARAAAGLRKKAKRGERRKKTGE